MTKKININFELSNNLDERIEKLLSEIKTYEDKIPLICKRCKTCTYIHVDCAKNGKCQYEKDLKNRLEELKSAEGNKL
jgi:hypothetical protein